ACKSAQQRRPPTMGSLKPFDRTAAVLCKHRTARTRIDRLPEELRPADESEAYTVQESLHAALSGAGWGEVAGHKIGCTTPVMQEYLGIANPCAGSIFAPTAHVGSASIDHQNFVRIGVECEIAVWLGMDLQPAKAPFEPASVAAAINACMA